jgi:hypothetical protein
MTLETMPKASIEQAWAKGLIASAALERGRALASVLAPNTDFEEDSVSERVERPWALMRHHAGWADVFHIETETADSITGFYPDRETVGPPVSYSMRAVLARFPTLEAARAAREGAVAEWRKHDAGVRDAEGKLRAAEKAREDAWLKCLQEAAAAS